MKELLVIARDDKHGDALMTLPAICGLAKQHDVIYLAMTNKKVQAIADFPPNVFDITAIEPPFRNRQLPVQVIGVGAAINYNFGPHVTMHTINHVMAWAGLDVDPAVVPRPAVKVEPIEGDVGFDVLFAPWAAARERSMSPEQVHEIVSAFPNSAIVGSRDDQGIFGPKNAYGLDFNSLANLMLKAKLVVTVDSFPSRLAHAIGVRKHLILDSGATPAHCQVYPGAQGFKAMYNSPQATWDILKLASIIKRMLNE